MGEKCNPTDCGSVRASVLVALLLALLVLSSSLLTTGFATTSKDLLKLGRPVVVRIPVESLAYSFVDDSTGNVVVVFTSNNSFQVAGYIAPLVKVEELKTSYPLQGYLVGVAASSKPSPSYIAFATDAGEILVLHPSRQGLVYRYIQAKDEDIAKIRASSTGSILAVFRDLSLRIYSVARGGWFEVGPIIGNASLWSKPGVSVYSAEMLDSLEGDRTAYQDVVAVYESIEEFPSYILLRVMYYNYTNLVPAPGVEVYAYIDNLGLFTPTVTTNPNGMASLPVALPTHNITIYVRDQNNTCYGFHFTGLNITEKGVTYPIPQPLILSAENITICPTPLKAVAFKIYAVQPGGLAELYSSTETVGGDVYLHAFLKPSLPAQNWSYLVISSGFFPSITQSDRILLFKYLDANYTEVAQTWMPIKRGAEVTSTAYTRSGDYIAVGFDDGLIIVYGYDENTGVYKALWTYRLPGAIRSIEFSEQLGRNTAVKGLVAIDETGYMQLLAVNSTRMLPVARAKNVPAFITGAGTTVSVSRDADQIAVSGQRSVYLVFGLGSAATSSPVKPVDVWNYILQKLVVTVREKDGTPVSNATVEIYRTGETKPLFILKTNSTGTTTIDYILPGSYIIKVDSGRYWLKKLETTIRVKPSLINTTQHVMLTLDYEPVPFTIKLKDAFTSKAIEEPMQLMVFKNVSGIPLNITNITVPPTAPPLGGMPVPPLNVTLPEQALVYNTTLQPGTELVTINLVKGTYRVILTPANPVDTIYKTSSFKIRIPGNETLNVVVQRKPRTLKIVLVDAKTSKAVEEPVSITVSWSGLTLYNGRVDAGQSIVTVSVPVKGNIRIDVIALPPGGEIPLYEGVSRVIDAIPPEGTTAIIVLKRRLIPVTVTILDNETKDVPLVPLKVTIDGKETIILKKGENVLSLKLDKGKHTIRIDPIPAYGKDRIPLYSNATLVLDVKSLISKTVFLNRIYSLLRVGVVDALTKGSPIDTIEVYANKTLIGAIKPGSKNLTVEKYLLKGRYEVAVVSLKEVYMPFKKVVDLVNDTLNFTIPLKRKIITFNLRIIDDTGAPITGARVTARGVDVAFTQQTTSVEGVASLNLPHGTYRVCVDFAGFSEYCKVLSPEDAKRSPSIPVILQPLPQTLLQRYLPLIIVVAVIAVVMIVIYRQRERILRAIAPEEEVF